MKLLVLTQKIDSADPVLGFMVNWMTHFSKHFEKVTVICLEKGSAVLPGNVSVHSLGKEDGRGRMSYVFNLFSFIWKYRREYDGVFVHMNQEYVLLAGLVWKMLRKPIVFWYNHTSGSWRTKLAMRFASVVCHTSPFAYTAGTKKSSRMPAGIDTEIFKKTVPEAKSESVMYIGRLAPLKNVDVLVAAVGVLALRNIAFSLDIYGAALKKDASYETALRHAADAIGKKGAIVFNGSVKNIDTPLLYSSHRAVVNLTPRGNYDKTVLESMACEALPVVSSEAFKDLIPPEFYFIENDSGSLASRLQSVLALPSDIRISYGKKFRELIIARHEISVLSRRLALIFDQLVQKTV